MKIIFVDINLVRTLFGNNFLILIMVRTLENDYFLMRTKLGYLPYSDFEAKSYKFTCQFF